MLKWGVVGCGRIANSCTIPALIFSNYSKVVAFMDVDRGRAQSTAERFNVAHWTTDLATFLENKEVEAVYVAVPNAYHARITKQIAAAGKHVLCEKPLGVDVAECQEMIAACQKHGVRLMVAQMSQFNNINRKAKEFIAAGAVGDVMLGRAYFAQRYEDYGDWRFDYQLSGGGALMDIGVYCVHTLREMIGSPVVEVSAHVDPLPHDHVVDMLVVATLKFENGALALLDTSFSYYSGHGAINEVKLRGEGSSVQICGTKGMVGVAETFSESGGGEFWAVVDGQKIDNLVQVVNPYATEMEHVSLCILEQRPSELDGEVGLEDVRVLMAMYESGRSGKPVQLRRR
jgi:D-xylose 1-dehydrogenase (NADP+, D-xylono-1,5-lactone-forming)